MKKYLYVIIIFAVVFVFSFIHSCSLYENDGNNIDSTFCTIEDFNHEIYKTDRKISLSVNTFPLNNDTVRYDSLVMQLVAWNTKLCNVLKNNNSFFIKSTYAAIPNDYYFSNSKIKSISISCNKDYNSAYKANQNLNDIFLVQYRNELIDPNLCSGECWEAFDTVRYKWAVFHELNEYLSTKPIEEFEYNFVIKEDAVPDTVISDCIFTIVYENTDGLKLIKEFKPITITP